MEKNKLLIFLFALLPGVSHMYLGMLKKGIFLMSLFLAPIALIFLTRGGMEIVSCILPVVWCYSFFDAFRFKCYNKEERHHMDIEFYKSLQIFWEQQTKPMLYRRRKLVGLCCIFLAIYTFIFNIIGYFVNWFGNAFWVFYIVLSKVPTLLVVLFLLKLGIDLLRKEDDDFVEYHKEYTKTSQKDIQQCTAQQYRDTEQHTQNNETQQHHDTEQHTQNNETQQHHDTEQHTQNNETQQHHDTEQQNNETQQQYQQQCDGEKHINVDLNKKEKIVEPIFLEKRIEE